MALTIYLLTNLGRNICSMSLVLHVPISRHGRQSVLSSDKSFRSLAVKVDYMQDLIIDVRGVTRDG